MSEAMHWIDPPSEGATYFDQPNDRLMQFRGNEWVQLAQPLTRLIPLIELIPPNLVTDSERQQAQLLAGKCPNCGDGVVKIDDPPRLLCMGGCGSTWLDPENPRDYHEAEQAPDLLSEFEETRCAYIPGRLAAPCDIPRKWHGNVVHGFVEPQAGCPDHWPSRRKADCEMCGYFDALRANERRMRQAVGSRSDRTDELLTEAETIAERVRANNDALEVIPHKSTGKDLHGIRRSEHAMCAHPFETGSNPPPNKIESAPEPITRDSVQTSPPVDAGGRESGAEVPRVTYTGKCIVCGTPRRRCDNDGSLWESRLGCCGSCFALGKERAHP